MKSPPRLPIPQKDYLNIEQRKILNWHRMILQVNNVSLWLVDLAGILKSLKRYKLLALSNYDDYFSKNTCELISLAKKLQILDVNAATLHLYGVKNKAQFLSSLSQRHTKDQMEVVKNLIVTILEGRHYLETETTACHSNGSNFKVCIKLIIPSDIEKNTKIIISVVSCLGRESVDSHFLNSKSLYETFVNNASVCIHEIDNDKRLLSMNQTGLDMMQIDNVCKIKGMQYIDFVAEKDRPRINYLMSRAFKGYSSEFEFQLVTESGLRVFSSCFIPMKKSDDKIENIIGVTQDITEQKKAAEELYHSANFDMLTDLPNRVSFIASVKQALVQASRHQHGLALLFIDLDNFKPVNDNFGHEAGDVLLQKVSHRIKTLLRKEDLVCRFGGDEFIVLLPFLKERSKASIIANKVLHCFSSPLDISGHEIPITVSIGISSYPEDGDDDKILISHSDDAMYNVKHLGGNGYQFYKDSTNS